MKQWITKRVLPVLLSITMIMGTSGMPIHAVNGTAHTPAHSYEAAGECGHTYTGESGTVITKCIHTHGPDCFPENNASQESVSGNQVISADPEPESRAPEQCTHVCSEESGCITRKAAPEADCPLCPIEDLITALPDADDVTDDNAQTVQAQLEEILALFGALTAEEQEQVDLSRCMDLQEKLDAGSVPAPLAESGAVKVEYWKIVSDGDDFSSDDNISIGDINFENIAENAPQVTLQETVYYGTLEDAWNSAKQETGVQPDRKSDIVAYITLLQDVMISDSLSLDGWNQQIILKGNNHKIMTAADFSRDAIRMETLGGYLGIWNTTIVASTTSDSNPAAVHWAGGKLEIQGSMLEGRYGLNCSGGRFLSVSNTTFHGTQNAIHISSSIGAIKYLKDLLGEGGVCYDGDNKPYPLDDKKIDLPAGTYSIIRCQHKNMTAWTDNGDGRHSRTCEDCSDYTQTERHVFSGKTGLCSLCNAQMAVATVDKNGSTTYYDTFFKAWEAAISDGGAATVTALKNIQLNDTLNIPDRSDITLTMVDGIEITSSSPSSMVYIYGGQFTLENGTLTSYGAAALQIDSGTVEIGKGSIKGHTYGILINDGQVTVENGNFHGDYYGMEVNGGSVTVNGGSFSGGSSGLFTNGVGNVSLCGGVFSKIISKKGTVGNMLGNAGGKNCAFYLGKTPDLDNDIPIQNLDTQELTDWTTVAPDNGNTPPVAPDVAKVIIDGNTTGYQDFAKAWEAAQGKTARIVLLTDVDLPLEGGNLDTLTGSNITLDAGVFTLSGNLANSGSGTICVNEGGVFTLVRGAIQGGVMANGGKITVNGGKITTNGQKRGIYINSDQSELVITNGTIDYLNLSKGKCTINGGSVTDGILITDGTLEIAGGTFFGNNALYAMGGSTTIRGGMFQGTNNGLYYYNQNAVVKISGGTFNRIQIYYMCQNIYLNQLLETDRAYYLDGNILLDSTKTKDQNGNITVKTCSHPNGNEARDITSGTHTVGCFACGKIEKNKPHEYGDWESDYNRHWHFCTVCKYKVSQTHTLDENGQCSVCQKQVTAPIEVEANGTTTLCYNFTDVNEAVKNAQKATITVLQTVCGETYLYIAGSGKDVTLRMADGVSLSANIGTTVTVQNNAHFTLESGTIISQGAQALSVSGAHVTIEDGNLIQSNSSNSDGSCLVLYANADVMINGGSFKSTGNGVKIVGNNSRLTINDVTFSAARQGIWVQNAADIILKGGTYTGTEAAIASTVAGVTVDSFLAAGYGFKQNGSWVENTSVPTLTGTVTVNKLPVPLDGASVTVSGAYFYTGTTIVPAAADVTVTLNGQTVNPDQYTISAVSNINAGTATITVTAKAGNEAYSGSASGTFIIEKATPAIGTVTAEALSDTFDASKVILNRTNQTISGTLTLTDSPLQYGDNTCHWKFTPNDTTNYTETDGEVTVTVKDTIPPFAEYRIGTNVWKALTDTVSSGSLFCKSDATVEIRSTDDRDGVTGSGIALTQYYLSDKEITDTDSIAWTTYTQPVRLDTPGTCLLYVRVTDRAGNEITPHSERIVVYGDSTADPETIAYTYKQNQDRTVSFVPAGNTVRELTDQDGNIIDAGHYMVGGDGALTLKAAFLDTLDRGVHTFRAALNPQGVVTDQVKPVCSFAVNVAPAPLTVTEAKATDRAYDGTDTVEITTVTLGGIAPGDDVAADFSGGVQGTLDSANAGTYSTVTLPELSLTGTDRDNYILTRPAAVATSVTITPLDGEITVGTDLYEKTFGDEAFAPDVTANHGEAEIRYEVTAGTDVISVSDGMITIRNAGSATITVSLPETTNYNAAAEKTITVHVAQKADDTTADLNKQYLYTQENADSIALDALLPADCGTITYETPVTTGNITYAEAPVIKDGKLCYRLNSGSTDDAGTITVVAKTQNYHDITITINVKLAVRPAEKAPNPPDSAMDVPNSMEKVGDVPLPEGWTWQESDRDTALTAGAVVHAVAVYTGAGQGSYENERITVVITRLPADQGTEDNQPGDDSQPGGNQPGNNQPGSNQPGGNQPGSNQPGPGNNQPDNNQTGNNQTDGNQSGSNQTGNNQPGNVSTEESQPEKGANAPDAVGTSGHATAGNGGETGNGITESAVSSETNNGAKPAGTGSIPAGIRTGDDWEPLPIIAVDFTMLLICFGVFLHWKKEKKNG